MYEECALLFKQGKVVIGKPYHYKDDDKNLIIDFFIKDISSDDEYIKIGE